MDSVSLRVQGLAVRDQVIVLARLAESFSEDRSVSPTGLDSLFDSIGLPRPPRVSNVLAGLEKDQLVSRPKNSRGAWRLTPAGRQRADDLANGLDVARLAAESKALSSGIFGHITQPTLPPWLSPPELLDPLREFLTDWPFDQNVFGMTRFPDEQDNASLDPVANALEVARTACRSHGLNFHLASDRKIVDDLWANVDAHMWACRYGIAFFEDLRGRGLNYNLTIEVGGMLTIGRRLALLKDPSIPKMPTDLVGKIYVEADLNDGDAVQAVLHRWIRDDLRLGSCSHCP